MIVHFLFFDQRSTSWMTGLSVWNRLIRSRLEHAKRFTTLSRRKRLETTGSIRTATWRAIVQLKSIVTWLQVIIHLKSWGLMDEEISNEIQELLWCITMRRNRRNWAYVWAADVSKSRSITRRRWGKFWPWCASRQNATNISNLKYFFKKMQIAMQMHAKSWLTTNSLIASSRTRKVVLAFNGIISGKKFIEHVHWTSPNMFVVRATR